MPELEHDLKLHLGCGPCRRSLTYSYHQDHPPSEKDQDCPECGEPMDKIEYDYTGKLYHPEWEA